MRHAPIALLALWAACGGGSGGGDDDDDEPVCENPIPGDDRPPACCPPLAVCCGQGQFTSGDGTCYTSEIDCEQQTGSGCVGCFDLDCGQACETFCACAEPGGAGCLAECPDEACYDCLRTFDGTEPCSEVIAVCSPDCQPP